MYNFLRVAAAAPCIKTADTRHNAEEIIRLANEAANMGAQALILPKYAITGAGCGDLKSQSAMLKGAEKAVHSIIKETKEIDLLIFLGLPLRVEGNILDVYTAIHKGQVICAFTDMKLWTRPTLSPGVYFYGGSELSENGSCCESTALKLQDYGNIRIGTDAVDVKVVILPDSNTTSAGGWEQNRRRAIAMSEINEAAYIYISSGPSDTVTEGVYGGGLLICEKGRVLAERPAFGNGESMIIADVDCELLFGSTSEQLTYRHAYTYFCKFEEANLSKPSLLRPIFKNPFFPENRADYPTFCADIFNIQKTALARRIEHTGAKRAVINVSGGLDSAMGLLVTAGAMDLLGRDRKDILALFLPGFGTTERTTNNTRLLTRALGAETREISIIPSCLQHFRDIGLNPGIPNTTYENAQARERTQIAMDIANMEGGLMVGTGNMSELALGFTTFGGDHLSMYNPNCGLTKTAVRETVAWAAASGLFTEETGKALKDILDTPVSPELLPPSDGKITQITEDTVGPYELIDFFLYHMINNGFAPDKIAFLAEQAFIGEYTTDVIRRWLRGFIKRFFANQFKRISLPEGPAVLGISLSPRSGFIMPGDAYGTDWLDCLDKTEKCDK